LERAFAVVERHVREGHLPAAVLAVAGPDGPAQIVACGANATGERVTAEHRFCVASVTKPIVATAVMQFVEEGRIALTEPIARRLPAFAPAPSPQGGRGEDIRLWHLLSHTSGVVDVARTPDTIPTREDIIQHLCRQALEFPPGAAYRYASDTFFLLADMVASSDGGATFADSLRERLLAPLGMTATSFRPEEPGFPSADLTMIGVAPEIVAAWRTWFAGMEHPGGGLWSSAADLMAFGRAMLHGGRLGGRRILGARSVALMTREQTAGLFEPGDPPRRPAYGFGWSRPGLTGQLPVSPGAFQHTGASGSRLLIDPQEGLVIALLAGVWGSPGERSDEVIAAVYAALEDPDPAPPPAGSGQ